MVQIAACTIRWNDVSQTETGGGYKGQVPIGFAYTTPKFPQGKKIESTPEKKSSMKIVSLNYEIKEDRA